MPDPTPISPSKTAFNTATISGRILEAMKRDQTWYTLVTTPAPDAYSHPQTLEIRSKQKIGSAGEDCQVGVMVGGFRRKQQYADKETGELKESSFTRVMLDAIED